MYGESSACGKQVLGQNQTVLSYDINAQNINA